MKASFFSAMLAAFMLATASVGGITASAAERASAGEDTAETTAVDEDSSADYRNHRRYSGKLRY